ncbi:unnamed protein product [Rhizophagus irregularis]|nr:unnamed protein product [Rhizophagus irregularis]
MDETPKDLWEDTDTNKYQHHVTIPTIDSTIESENVDERVVYIGDLEKRKQAYGICGEYFLNEIKSHLQIYIYDIVQCFGITQDPNNKEYMMVIEYYIEDRDDSEDGEDGEDIEDNEDSEDNEDEDSKNGSNSQKNLLSFQFSSDTSYTAQSTSANLISECLDVQLSELELNEICQDGEDNFE